MKKITFLIATIALFTATNELSAQTAEKNNNKTEITLEDDNGVKVLTIVTTDDKNNLKTEQYKGKDAEAKLAEIEKAGATTKTEFVDADGVLRVKIEQK